MMAPAARLWVARRGLGDMMQSRNKSIHQDGTAGCDWLGMGSSGWALRDCLTASARAIRGCEWLDPS